MPAEYTHLAAAGSTRNSNDARPTGIPFVLLALHATGYHGAAVVLLPPSGLGRVAVKATAHVLPDRHQHGQGTRLFHSHVLHLNL